MRSLVSKATTILLASSLVPLRECWQSLLVLMDVRIACGNAGHVVAQPGAVATSAADHEAQVTRLEYLASSCGQAVLAIQQVIAAGNVDGPWRELEGTAGKLADRTAAMHAEMAAQSAETCSAGRFEWVDGTLTRWVVLWQSACCCRACNTYRRMNTYRQPSLSCYAGPLRTAAGCCWMGPTCATPLCWID